MATIRRRGSSWQVQIRRKGAASVTRTFPDHQAAKLWARDQARRGSLGKLLLPSAELVRITVSDLLERYQREVTVSKRGSEKESSKITAICRTWLAEIAVAKLAPSSVAAFRDERLRRVRPATVRRELAIISHCFEIARREWGMPVANPVKEIRLPPASPGRERRLTLHEFRALSAALARSRATYLKPLSNLAIETGMRRGELLSLKWADIDFSSRTASLNMTKNGTARRVPLSRKAIEAINETRREGERLFSVKPGTVRQAWDYATRRAGIEGYRFHDLRHEATSRFFELGLSVPEVALITGHKDIRMLFRYTHLKIDLVVRKLDALQAALADT